MRKRGNRVLACLAAASAAAGAGAVAATAGSSPPPRAIALTPVGTYDTGLGDGSGDVTSGETAALSGNRMYVTNSTGSTLDVVDVSDRRRRRSWSGCRCRGARTAWTCMATWWPSRSRPTRRPTGARSCS